MPPIDPTAWNMLDPSERALPDNDPRADDWKVVLGLLGAVIFAAFAIGFLIGRAWA